MLGLENRMILKEVKQVLKSGGNLVLVSDKRIKTVGNTKRNIENIEGATRLLQKMKEELEC